MRVSVSIVMPVLNEASRIVSAVRRLSRDFGDCELIVVDGGSSDGTRQLLEEMLDGAASTELRVVTSHPGRARQMNTGARHAHGDVLWFIHADTAIDPNALPELQRVLADPQVVGGGLTLRFDRTSIALRYLAWTSNIRARRLHWIFGDQALFVRRTAFYAVGGFPELPIMEDLDLSRRLARLGDLAVLTAASTASTRQFDEHGTWPMLVFMQWLKLLHFCGVDPARIARRYAAGPPRPLRSRSPKSPQLLDRKENIGVHSG